MLEELIKHLNNFLGLDESHTVIAVFENNDNPNIIGWSVIERGMEGDYPILTLEQLIEQYKSENNK